MVVAVVVVVGAGPTVYCPAQLGALLGVNVYTTVALASASVAGGVTMVTLPSASVVVEVTVGVPPFTLTDTCTPKFGTMPLMVSVAELPTGTVAGLTVTEHCCSWPDAGPATPITKAALRATVARTEWRILRVMTLPWWSQRVVRGSVLNGDLF